MTNETEKTLKKGLKTYHIILIVVGILLLWVILSLLLTSGRDVLTYYGNGNIESNTSINEDGEGITTFYYENGNIEQIQTGTFKNKGGEWGLFVGEIIFYYESGNIEQMERGTFKGDLIEGESILYYESGNKELEFKGTFDSDNGLIEGEIIYYNENGNKEIEYEGTFRFNELTEGTGTFYNEDGTISWVEEF